MRVIIARLVVVQAQLVVKALGGVAVAGGRNVFRVPLLAPRVVAQPGTDAAIGIEYDVDVVQARPEPVEEWSVSRKLTAPFPFIAAILPPLYRTRF
jgi:hypothetical protein